MKSVNLTENTTLSEAERKPAEKEDETVTDTVSRSLMANYLALKQADQLDKESAQKLIDQAINYYRKHL